MRLAIATTGDLLEAVQGGLQLHLKRADHLSPAGEDLPCNQGEAAFGE